MKFKEITNKITGISCPIFGLSWTPDKLEIDTAQRIITFLEDKRVLYNLYELEMPQHCVESINQIRSFLTEQLYDIKRDTELSLIIRAMRNACRRFLDSTANQSYYNKHSYIDLGGMFGQMHFYSGIGEFRGNMGPLIAKVLIMHGLDCESDLNKILPVEILDD